MNLMLRGSSLALLLSALAACYGTDEPAEQAPEAVVVEPAAAPAGGMDGMAGMEGVQADGTTDPLSAHMKMMEGASGEDLKAMLPEHRQLVANTIARMNREMRDMNMSDNTEWNATVQALRDDLVQLPEMTPEELRAFMPGHQARIDRLNAMHRDMMGSMQM